MIRRWLALTYYLYALRLAALSHFYFNPLYNSRYKYYAYCAICATKFSETAKISSFYALFPTG